jgi:hypothetical protein
MKCAVKEPVPATNSSIYNSTHIGLGLNPCPRREDGD